MYHHKQFIALQKHVDRNWDFLLWDLQTWDSSCSDKRLAYMSFVRYGQKKEVNISPVRWDGKIKTVFSAYAWKILGKVVFCRLLEWKYYLSYPCLEWRLLFSSQRIRSVLLKYLEIGCSTGSSALINEKNNITIISATPAWCFISSPLSRLNTALP